MSFRKILLFLAILLLLPFAIKIKAEESGREQTRFRSPLAESTLQIDPAFGQDLSRSPKAHCL